MPEQKVLSVSKKSVSYSIKKVLRAMFKSEHSSQKSTRIPMNYLESLDNVRNSETEIFYDGIEDNSINEKLACLLLDGENHQIQSQPLEEEDVYVPVRFARTEVGTFFWTTNLQPVTSIAPAADKDLVQPAYCYTNSQYPQFQFNDRWAQA